MEHNLHLLLTRPELAHDIARNGLQRIGEMHTCARRVDQLFNILAVLTQEERLAGPSCLAR
ncbi:MAG: hypothetical protein JO279_11950 [Verrucomicrobia bacterium]|nr:hypothetical protein [Verrucomicrobiota bacterium]